MLVKEIIGHADIESPEEKEREWIELDWDELNKRILRKHTDKGREVAIMLDKGHLHVGDIVFENESVQILIRTKLEDVYVIRPKSMKEIGKTAFELGNRHTPCLIEEHEIIVRYDATLEKLFKEVGVDYEKTERRFKQPFKYRGHQH